VAKLRRELDHVDTLVDQQARVGAAQISRARVLRETDRGGQRLKESLSPVVPVVAGPPPAASRTGTQVRRRSAGTAAASAAGLAHALEQSGLALDDDPLFVARNVIRRLPTWSNASDKASDSGREPAYASGDTTIASISRSSGSRIAISLPRLSRRIGGSSTSARIRSTRYGASAAARALGRMLRLGDQRDRVCGRSPGQLGALEDRPEDGEGLEDRGVADALLALLGDPRLDRAGLERAQWVLAPL
jgi:hypothetical protein